MLMFPGGMSKNTLVEKKSVFISRKDCRLKYTQVIAVCFPRINMKNGWARICYENAKNK